jgi:transposase
MKPYRVLTDEEWLAVAPLLPELQPRKETRGRPLTNTREVLNGVLWVMHSGSSWSMLPRRFPSYQTCHRRFEAWQRTGVLRHVLTRLFGPAGDEFHTAIVARMRHPPPDESMLGGESGDGQADDGSGQWDAGLLHQAFQPLGSQRPHGADTVDHEDSPGPRSDSPPGQRPPVQESALPHASPPIHPSASPPAMAAPPCAASPPRMTPVPELRHERASNESEWSAADVAPIEGPTED